MPRGKVAGIDVGTSRVKLEVYDEGELVYRHSVANSFIITGDRVEQDPLTVLSNVKLLVEKAREAGARCMGFATYRASIVAWREPSKPLTNIVTWMDRRSLQRYDELPLKARLASRLPIIKAALSPESPMVKLKILTLEEQRLVGELRSGSARAWNIDGYLLESLTGLYMSDPSNMGLMGVVNPKTLKPVWATARLLDLPKIPLPGTLYHDEQLESGGLLIGPFIGDQQAANHGLGCLEEGCVRVSMGSGLFASIVVGGEARISPGRGLVPLVIYRDRSSGVYGVEGYITGLGRAVEWFVENLLGGDYGLLDSAAGSPGKPPLIIPFFWGLRHPRLRRGVAAVLGIEPGYTVKDIARGLAHSIAASTSYLLDALRREAPGPSRIILTGGLSRLAGLAGLTASYLGGRVERGRDPDAPARGAAILAARACGAEEPAPLETEPVAPLEGVDTIEPDSIFEAARRMG